MQWRVGIFLLLLACTGGLQLAEVMSSEPADEAVQARLIAISGSLSCLVCKGEPLAGAQAGLAQDLRREISSMIQQGNSDQEIIDAMLARYSDLLRYHTSNAVTKLLVAGGGDRPAASRGGGRVLLSAPPSLMPACRRADALLLQDPPDQRLRVVL